MGNADLKLLVFEENQELAGYYFQALSQLNQEIYIAENEKKADQLFSEHMPSLILSNIRIIMKDTELIKKFRQINPQIRIVLIADAFDSKFIIRAIESGIKTFLLKPFKRERLLKVIKEQLFSINLETRLEIEQKRRKLAEKEYDKSNLILQSLAQATTLFFRSGFNEHTAREALSLIGEVTNASRVYIYQNSKQNKQIYTNRIHEWNANGIEPSFNSPEGRRLLITRSGFEIWRDSMKKNGYFSAVVSELTEPEKLLLAKQNIQSILIIPISVNNKWWGFLGFDDCVEERSWVEAELNAMKSLAYNLGGAIYRKQLDDEMIKLNLNLEQRIKDRTSELEIEVFERNIAEALLKDSEEKYRLIYEHASYGILLMHGGKITMINPALIEIFEDIPRNLIGRDLVDLVPRKFKSIVNEKLGREREDASQETFEIQVNITTKRHKWLELKPTLISWYGEPAFLVFVSNISLRKQAEQELHLLNSSLENRIENEIRRVEQQRQLLVQKSKLESMGELSAGLAHEINQPLVSISMALDNMLMMMADDKLTDDYLKYKIQILFKDIDRIRNIIEHVRIFSRDQQIGNESEISINQVIKDALSMIKIQFADHNVHLLIDMDHNDLITYGNQYKLEQVILNLLSNAKYAVEERSKKAGDISYEKQISISCKQLDSHAVINITDNGTGIEKSILSNIFNPFFTTKDEEKGTGLGLSISYGIIKEMKGEIRVNSMINEFTKITIELPLMKQQLV